MTKVPPSSSAAGGSCASYLVARSDLSPPLLRLGPHVLTLGRWYEVTSYHFPSHPMSF